MVFASRITSYSSAHLPSKKRTVSEKKKLVIVGDGQQAVTLLLKILEQSNTSNSSLRHDICILGSEGPLERFLNHLSLFSPSITLPKWKNRGDNFNPFIQYAETIAKSFQDNLICFGQDEDRIEFSSWGDESHLANGFRTHCRNTLKDRGLNDFWRQSHVQEIRANENGFEITTKRANGSYSILQAEQVVLTGQGIQKRSFPELPDKPTYGKIIHSHDLTGRQLSQFRGKNLVIKGRGFSTIGLTLKAIEEGAKKVKIISNNPIQVTQSLFPGWTESRWSSFSKLDDNLRLLELQSFWKNAGISEYLRSLLDQSIEDGKLEIHSGIGLETIKANKDRVEYTISNSCQTYETDLFINTGAGFSIQFAKQELLRNIDRDYGIQEIGIYPKLNDDLSLPGLKHPLYLMGGLASLKLGPTAFNTLGANRACSILAPIILNRMSIN